MWKSILVIAMGSIIGGLLRWILGLKLNSFSPMIPAGTLVANLLAAYIAGFAIAYFVQVPGLAIEWRLLIITGFCGALSTFSTFSVEVTGLIQRGQFVWAASAIAIHVLGSLLMTLAGIISWQWLKSL